MPNAVGITHSFNCSKSKHDQYRVLISCRGFELVADMPEEFATSVASEWESLLPSALQGAVETVGKIAFGTSAQNQYLTEQVWVGTSPIDLSLSLQFHADSDGFAEVVRPIRTLEMLSMPASIGGWLYSPGPNRGKLAGGDLSVRIAVGKQFVLENAIVTSVQSTFSTRLDEKGFPKSGKTDLQIKSSTVLSRGDWANITNVPNIF